MQLYPLAAFTFLLSPENLSAEDTRRTGVHANGRSRLLASWRLANWCQWLLCGILLTCRGYAAITLVWDDANTNATGWSVYQSAATGPFTKIMSVSTKTATIQEIGATNRFYVAPFNSAGEGPISNIYTNVQATTPPPTGVLGISAPTLSSTSLQRGQTLTATARFTNGTSAVVTVNEGWLTARQPGASNSSGPFDDWSPGLAAQTVGPGGIVTLTASWTVRADAPFGTWQAHLAVKVDGVYNDGPNTAFQVVAPPTQPPAAPQNLRAIQVGTRNIRMEWRGNVAASTEVERSEENNPYMKIAIVPAGIEQYNDDNVRRHRDFRYRVRNVSAFATSGYSNELFYSSR